MITANANDQPAESMSTSGEKPTQSMDQLPLASVVTSAESVAASAENDAELPFSVKWIPKQGHLLLAFIVPRRHNFSLLSLSFIDYEAYLSSVQAVQNAMCITDFVNTQREIRLSAFLCFLLTTVVFSGTAALIDDSQRWTYLVPAYILGNMLAALLHWNEVEKCRHQFGWIFERFRVRHITSSRN
jgi:hypothetical protein